MTGRVDAAATRIATCSSGQHRATSVGEPPRVSICHCGACKRRTGSAFSWNATFAKDQVTVSGEARTHRRNSDEGRWGDHYFCPECGVVVFYEIEARPDMVSIPVGTFADSAFPEPTFSVYGELRPAWIGLRTSAPLTEQ